MNMITALLVTMGLFFNAAIAIAQDASPSPSPTAEAAVEEAAIEIVKHADKIPMPPAQAPWWVDMLSDTLGNFPDFNAGLIAVLVFLSLLLRGSAELLGFVAQKTKTDKDDKLLAYISKAALWAGAVLGWFGGGKPKQVDKAKEKAG